MVYQYNVQIELQLELFVVNKKEINDLVNVRIVIQHMNEYVHQVMYNQEEKNTFQMTLVAINRLIYTLKKVFHKLLLDYYYHWKVSNDEYQQRLNEEHME